MKISEVKEKSKGIDDKIIALIDLKTEDDMKQVILQLQSTEKSIDQQLHAIEKVIEANEKKHNFVLWVVSAAFAVIAVLLTIIAIK